MDQLKIGNFIAKCRKEKNLTQLELADKLNITDRAVSKWETGKGMPDASIMLELCDILGITANELLKGEYISKEDISKETNKNIIKILDDYKKTKKTGNKFKIISIILLIIIAIIVSFYSVMYVKYKIANNYEYISISQANEDNLYNLAEKYIIEKQNPVYQVESKDSKINYNISDFKVFTKTEKLGIMKNGEDLCVFAWIENENYYVQNNNLIISGGGSNIYKFIVNSNKIIGFEEMPLGNQKIKDFLPTEEMYNKYTNINQNEISTELKKEAYEYYSYLNLEELLEINL